MEEELIQENFKHVDYSLVVGRVRAVDRDSPKYNAFEYVMDSTESDQAARMFFNVDPIDGSVLALKPLDREQVPSFHLVIAAFPTGYLENFHPAPRCSVTITVTDINDNKPVFIYPSRDSNETIAISNKTPVGHKIVRIEARDDDYEENATVTYYFSPENGNPGNVFLLDYQSGLVSLAVSLEEATFKEILLKFVAQDSGSNPLVSGVAELRIIVSKEIPFIDGELGFGDLLYKERVTMVVMALTLVFLLLSLCAVMVAIMCMFKRRSRAYPEDAEISKCDIIQNKYVANLSKDIPYNDYPAPQATHQYFNTTNGHVLRYDVSKNDEIIDSSLVVDSMGVSDLAKVNKV